MSDPLTILNGDCLEQLRTLPDQCVNTCVTSPPYWGLRDYGVAGQIGLEKTPAEYVAKLVEVFREVRRVLKDNGTLWMNLGDSYNAGRNGGHAGGKNGVSRPEIAPKQSGVNVLGLNPKNLVGIPWRVALALQADGWFLRSDIIWHKPNPMPESVQGSHWERHRITIEEYENLSGMSYTGERSNKNWPGNMPGMSAEEISRGQEALSAKRKRKTHSKSERRKTGCESQEESVCSISTGNLKCEKVSVNAQGEGESSKAVCKLSEPTGAGGRRSECAGLDGDSGEAQEPMLLLPKESIQSDNGSRHTTEPGRPELTGEHCSGVQKLQLQETRQDRSSMLIDCPGCPICEPCGGYIFHLSAGRPTKAHEYIFLLSKSEKYYYDYEAILEPCSPGTHARLAQDIQNQIGSARANGGAKTNGNMKAVARKSWKGSTFDAKRDLERHPNVGRNRVKDNLSMDSALAIMPELRNKRTVWMEDDHKALLNWLANQPEGQELLAQFIEESRNKADVFTVSTAAYNGAHFATFPPNLIRPCILAGCPAGGTVLEPFAGSGTTGQVALELGRKAILIELNHEYVELIKTRCNITPGLALV
jgi:DNA modification methylase